MGAKVTGGTYAKFHMLVRLRTLPSSGRELGLTENLEVIRALLLLLWPI